MNYNNNNKIHHTAATKSAKLNKIEEIIQSSSVIFEGPVEKNEMIQSGIFINKGTTDSTVPLAAKLHVGHFFIFSRLLVGLTSYLVYKHNRFGLWQTVKTL